MFASVARWTHPTASAFGRGRAPTPLVRIRDDSASYRAEIASNLAAEAGVADSAVSLTFSAASVQIEARLTP
eukprot:6667662-Prymnesium_polylepis.1